MCVLAGQAQEVHPGGRFLVDSLKVGMPVPYSLAVKYPRGQRVLFPDSTHSFAPFEWDRMKYYPTRSDDLFSYDSAVYFLSTFEVDSAQWLRLPIYVVKGRDSLAYYTIADTVFLIHTVHSLPDSVEISQLAFREDTVYRKIPLRFNYIVFYAWFVGVLAGGTLLLLIFWGPAKRYWTLYKLRSAHVRFQQQFQQLRSQIPEEGVEPLVVYWKTYAQHLTGIGFTTLTTRELAQDREAVRYQESLRTMDRIMYGGAPVEEMNQILDFLAAGAEAMANQKQEEVKNGR
jgi:hypothetical protein